MSGFILFISSYSFFLHNAYFILFEVTLWYLSIMIAGMQVNQLETYKDVVFIREITVLTDLSTSGNQICQ